MLLKWNRLNNPPAVLFIPFSALQPHSLYVKWCIQSCSINNIIHSELKVTFIKFHYTWLTINLGKKFSYLSKYLIFPSINEFWFISEMFHHFFSRRVLENEKGIGEGRVDSIHPSTFMECLVGARPCAKSWNHKDER